MKYYQGHIMLFGVFRVRKCFAFWKEITSEDVQIGALYTDNAPYTKRLTERSKYLKRLEPFLRNLCTIKWVESEKNPKIICYF